MHQVTLLEKASRQTVQDMAHAAAERGDDLTVANVFPVGTDNNRDFRSAYLKRQAALDTATTTA
jgi:hypothetical protein